ncbi:thioredoxin family protein [Solemya velum gill symbiont]|uniref:Thioredoxin-like fold domain-containing protein n=2 Tax=Solemya velum gill symbiont TaxID=2340 RepID=A0A1T2ENX2_SOVGS|nr:thioredoxin family protein [Solemya velum gill symbiont]OOY34312.1 hypothetical protein BOV88_10525 [Solemya velum gill symbiont]OOY36962.1 hypothetical protein BOV89_09685 [Solemya velum gill symbiont]OOY40663.1 hypothetical protein BOV90_02915 [Solemya velum gill symbiont]OOY44455.1 hypothetical protein BOV91_01305 [Solemya velum gill symbiont]OOY45826.1 hypothetical protein BOV93_12160 [Solemya velum gill symbiont]
MTNNQVNPPDVLLLIAPGCPHCPAVMQSLSNLLKEGVIGRLEIVNIAPHPEVADKVGTRSVPWMRIGEVELSGAHTPEEIREWVDRSSTSDTSEVISHLLETNRLEQAIEKLRNNSELLRTVIARLPEEEVPFSVRIGIGAIIEELAHTDTLEASVPLLLELAASDNRQARSDAAHYLGFTKGTATVVEALKKLGSDSDMGMSKIALESLEALEQQ